MGGGTNDSLADMGWCELKSPIAGVIVGLSQKEEVTKGAGTVLTWGVKDIEAAHKSLKSHDVTFDGDILEIPEMVKLLTFFDPDGNTLMVAQDLSK